MSIKKVYKVKINIKKNSSFISPDMKEMGKTGKIYEAEYLGNDIYFIDRWFFSRRDLIIIDEEPPPPPEPQLFDVGLLDI